MPSLANLSISTCNWHSIDRCTPLQYCFETSRPELVQLKLDYVPLPTGIREILSHKLQQLSVSIPPGSRHLEFYWRALRPALEETSIALSFLEVLGMENAIFPTLDYGG